jgi:hypothetical protein
MSNKNEQISKLAAVIKDADTLISEQQREIDSLNGKLASASKTASAESTSAIDRNAVVSFVDKLASVKHDGKPLLAEHRKQQFVDGLSKSANAVVQVAMDVLERFEKVASSSVRGDDVSVGGASAVKTAGDGFEEQDATVAAIKQRFKP